MEYEYLKNLNVEEYEIASKYYKKDKMTDIVVVSNLQFHSNLDELIYKSLLYYCQKTGPHYIVLTGNILANDSKKTCKTFEYLIRAMAEICPVIITSYTDNTDIFKYLESLNKINNVYFLNNEKVYINDLMFVNFNPRLNASNLDYLAPIIEYLKVRLSMYEDYYNILLTNRPILFKTSETLQDTSSFVMTDLTITPQEHNDLEDALSLDLAPDINSKNIYDYGRGYLLTSQEFRKFKSSNILFRQLEKMTQNNLERIRIVNHLAEDANDVCRIRRKN